MRGENKSVNKKVLNTHLYVSLFFLHTTLMLNISGIVFFKLQAENIMFLELDMTPPTLFQMDFQRAGSETESSRDVQLDNASYREKVAASRVRKSQSWSVWCSFSYHLSIMSKIFWNGSAHFHEVLTKFNCCETGGCKRCENFMKRGKTVSENLAHELSSVGVVISHC